MPAWPPWAPSSGGSKRASRTQHPCGASRRTSSTPCSASAWVWPAFPTRSTRTRSGTGLQFGPPSVSPAP
eukprot:2634940-Alexandrium_andersonii.AAC.1